MVGYGLLHQREAEAGAFLLRGEKWLENLMPAVLGDAGSRVLDDEDRTIALDVGPAAHPAPVGGGLERVANQVEQRSAEAVSVHLDLTRTGLRLEPDALRPAGSGHLGRSLHEICEIPPVDLRRALARVFQEVVHDGGQDVQLTEDPLHVLATGVVRGQVFFEQPPEELDAAEGVAHFVGDAGEHHLQPDVPGLQVARHVLHGLAQDAGFGGPFGRDLDVQATGAHGAGGLRESREGNRKGAGHDDRQRGEDGDGDRGHPQQTATQTVERRRVVGGRHDGGVRGRAALLGGQRGVPGLERPTVGTIEQDGGRGVARLHSVELEPIEAGADIGIADRASAGGVDEHLVVGRANDEDSRDLRRGPKLVELLPNVPRRARLVVPRLQQQDSLGDQRRRRLCDRRQAPPERVFERALSGSIRNEEGPTQNHDGGADDGEQKLGPQPHSSERLGQPAGRHHLGLDAFDLGERACHTIAGLDMPSAKPNLPDHVDWRRVAHLLLVSRAMDHVEETELVPSKQVLYQFSARGHDMAQLILGGLLTHPHDAISGYYRSRPALLALGLDFADALAGPLGRSGGFSDGRDIGVVCNLPSEGAAKVLPMAGGVGTQYTPVVGWSQALTYRARQLGEEERFGAIGVSLGGDGSVATNGFWSALTIATTQRLPYLFFIEDNAYGLSVPSDRQTPDGNIAANLASFGGLEIFEGDGAEPTEAAELVTRAVGYVREWEGPALCRLRVPRLSGHSAQDTQAYKDEVTVEGEKARDPLPKLKAALVPAVFSTAEWSDLEEQAETEVRDALASALARPQPDGRTIHTHVFTEYDEAGAPRLQQVGGLWREGHVFPPPRPEPEPEPTRINMLTAIRRTLDVELKSNPKLLLFGEDVGPKGGVHGATLGLQETYGEARVFDTSLSEEGIIGRAVGMAYAGLMPVAEIQFRKYADPAQEQLNDAGTVRWRTKNRFAAPIVVRMPGGFAKCGDPWHSQCDEAAFIHAVGWRVAFPSNAEDAVGLLRAAMRGNDPTLFFEHRTLLDAAAARRPYPGDGYVLEFGRARRVASGDAITIVTWGAMVDRVEQAVAQTGVSADVIDLRTLVPWDEAAVLDSVERTGRCLVVHEDVLTSGFGAEIAARIASEAFLFLKAPVDRLAVNDVPLPYNPELLAAVLPSVDGIATKIEELVEFA
jgi:2-oxoisovalerate dehydrogenase E1 component